MHVLLDFLLLLLSPFALRYKHQSATALLILAYSCFRIPVSRRGCCMVGGRLSARRGLSALSAGQACRAICSACSSTTVDASRRLCDACVQDAPETAPDGPMLDTSVGKTSLLTLIIVSILEGSNCSVFTAAAEPCLSRTEGDCKSAIARGPENWYTGRSESNGFGDPEGVHEGPEPSLGVRM